MKWWGWIVIVVVLLLGVEFWVYRYGGIKEYREVVREISLLPEELREEAKVRLSNEGSYSGTVMMISALGRGGVWVWGSKGPKFFRASSGSAFSYYSMCDRGYLLKRLEKGRSVKAERRVYADIDLWKKNVKPGDYVVAVAEDVGQNVAGKGRLKEVWAYDWWPFLRVNMEEWCERR
jgi:hypothetical protein